MLAPVDETILDLLDAAAAERVLVYGSLPPEGRDVDLLVRPPERTALEGALEEAAFVRHGGVWARFANCAATVVDLADAEVWRLPQGELAALYAEAAPLEGRSNLVRPSPRHTLLILARRSAYGPLGERQRARLAAAVTDDPAAWDRARERASAWGVEEQLEALVRGDAPRLPTPRAAARRLRKATRGNVVCLSGLDGAGKSSQAEALRETLHALGVDAVVEWRPFGQNPTLARASQAAALVLRTVRRLGAAGQLEERAASGQPLLAQPGGAQQRGSAGRATLFAWTTVVALANALHQRRTAAEQALHGRVVIFDRYSLDSIVRLRYMYGEAERFRFQSFLIRALSPKPRCAFLLEVAPETALGRKVDQWNLDDLRRQFELYREEAERQGVVRLDGERPREDLCAEIAAAVWRSVA
jgi:thymidylate kinase